MEKKNQRSLQDKCLSTYDETEDVKWAKGPYCLLFFFFFSLTALWPNPSFPPKRWIGWCPWATFQVLPITDFGPIIDTLFRLPHKILVISHYSRSIGPATIIQISPQKLVTYMGRAQSVPLGPFLHKSSRWDGVQYGGNWFYQGVFQSVTRV
jgi:hypothetical protein